MVCLDVPGGRNLLSPADGEAREFRSPELSKACPGGGGLKAMAEILVVDDERYVRLGLRSVLTAAGYDVREAASGAAAREAVRAQRPDLVLLDVMMPGEDGFSVCRALRAADRELPVVFLTARDSDGDEARGLEVGADDFLPKTVPEEILLARLGRTLLRTTGLSVRFAPGNLTKTEADIYRVLASAPGRMFTYREIYAAIRGEGYYGDEGAIRSHICRLREKLPPPETIQTQRGRGYALAQRNPARPVSPLACGALIASLAMTLCLCAAGAPAPSDQDAVVPPLVSTNAAGVVSDEAYLQLKAENDALRRENQLLRRELVTHRKRLPDTLLPSKAVAPEVRIDLPAEDTGYWISSKSGIRHNRRCRNYRKVRGKPCGPTDGKPCKKCGG